MEISNFHVLISIALAVMLSYDKPFCKEIPHFTKVKSDENFTRDDERLSYAD